MPSTPVAIIDRTPVFLSEKKVSDNLFLVQLAGERMFYGIRLYPFAVFEVPGGQLTEEDALGLEGSFEDIKPFSYMQPLLILTTKCNLACTYCYAHQGTYGMGNQVMSRDILEKTVAYLRRIIVERYIPSVSRFDTTELGLICFGGEPLLTSSLVRSSHRMLCTLCEELNREYGTSFVPTMTINTNGYKLDTSMLSFMKAHSSDLEVVVSYDGQLHDLSRITQTGKGSANRVLLNIYRLHDAGVDVSVTTCVLPEMTRNPSLFTDGLGEFYRNGIPVNPSFIRGPLEGVSSRAVYPGLVQKAYDTASLDGFGDVIASEIQRGACIYSRRYRRRLLEGGYRYRCGAGLYEFAVTPDGIAYPCHNFISEQFKLGDVTKPGFDISRTHPLLQQLQNRMVRSLTPCSDCVFQSTCMSSFDCPAHSHQDLHDIGSVDDRFCGFARKVQHALLVNFIKEMQHGQP